MHNRASPCGSFSRLIRRTFHCHEAKISAIGCCKLLYLLEKVGGRAVECRQEAGLIGHGSSQGDARKPRSWGFLPVMGLLERNENRARPETSSELVQMTKTMTPKMRRIVREGNCDHNVRHIYRLNKGNLSDWTFLDMSGRRRRVTAG